MAEEVERYDYLGRRLRVGDYVAFAKRQDRAVKLTIGKVIELERMATITLNQHRRLRRYPGYNCNEKCMIVINDTIKRHDKLLLDSWKP